MTRSAAGGQRGAGDRWLAGEHVEGVEFGHHAAVEIVSGRFGGTRGRVELLLAIDPEPQYLIALGGGAGTAKVRQSALRALH